MGDNSFEGADRSEVGLQQNGHLYHVEFVERTKPPYLRQHPLNVTIGSQKDKRVLRTVRASTFLNSGVSPCVTLRPCLCVAPRTLVQAARQGCLDTFLLFVLVLLTLFLLIQRQSSYPVC